MTLLRSLLGNLKAVVGLLTVAIAILSLLAPEPIVGLLAPVVSILDDLGSATLLAGLTVLAAGYGLWRGSSRGTAGEERFVDQQPEAPTQTTPVAGQSFDRDVDAFRDLAVLGRETGRPVARVREELTETAVATYARVEGISEAAARDAVESGEWTHDRVATSFLSTEAGTFTILERIRAVLLPDREFEHRAERTVASIERLADSGRSQAWSGSGGAQGVDDGVRRVPTSGRQNDGRQADVPPAPSTNGHRGERTNDRSSHFGHRNETERKRGGAE